MSLRVHVWLERHVYRIGANRPAIINKQSLPSRVRKLPPKSCGEAPSCDRVFQANPKQIQAVQKQMVTMHLVHRHD